MRFELRATGGGLTVFDREAGETFKSQHNAAVETEEVFFRPGVRENPWWGNARPFRVLELGFGLGTNFLYALGAEIEFVSVERDLAGARFLLTQGALPPLEALVETKEFRQGRFSAQLIEEDFFTALPRLVAKGEKFHCVYFDPFSPKANPEAWAPTLFSLCAALLHPGGRLVTYSVSRSAKDAAQGAGFLVNKHHLPAALNKRSALLAIKPGELVE
jgi:tRNA U34 5-methylaminomethyl-2-thiouridine-forming methyltransferase MnmC